MANWYCGSTKYAAVTAWAASTAYSVGDLRRQLTTSNADQKRVFRCTTAGTSGASQPFWILTKAGVTTDGSCQWTEVTGNSTYGWLAAHATLERALAWCAQGDTIWVSSAHNQVPSLGFNDTNFGTTREPITILSVSDAATPPTTLASGAAISGGNVGFSGNFYIHGFAFSGGSFSASTWLAPGGWSRYENCTVSLTGSTAGVAIGGGVVEFINVPITFSHVNQGITSTAERFVWSNTPTAVTGTAPTTLFAASGGHVILNGIDLSGMGSNFIFSSSSSATSVANNGYSTQVDNCRLGAGQGLAFLPAFYEIGGSIEAVNSYSGDENFRFERRTFPGTETSIATTYRSGGATDGTTPISRKLNSFSQTNLYFPLISVPMFYWNDTVGAPITITVETLTDGVTLTDGDAWLEVEYLGTNGYPKATLIDDRKSNPLGSSTNQTTSTVSWVNSFVSPVKQKLEVTFTPQEKGLVRARVKLARPSTTMYFDPLVLSSSGRQYQAGHFGYFNEAVAAGGGSTCGKRAGSSGGWAA